MLAGVLAKVRQECPGLLMSAWYSDDGKFVGPAAEVRKAVEVFEREGGKVGLRLQHSKSWATYVSPQPERGDVQWPMEVRTTVNFEALGVPIGDTGYTLQRLLEKVKKQGKLLQEIQCMEDAQKAFSLLFYCCGFGKVVFWGRTVPVDQSRDALAEWDKSMREALDAVVGMRQTDAQWEWSTLPVRLGGCGLRKAEEHREAAYMASRSMTKKDVERLVGMGHRIEDEFRLDLAVGWYNERVGVAEQVAVAQVGEGVEQRKLSKAVDEAKREQLVGRARERGDLAELARMRARGAPFAGAWMRAVPCEGLGLGIPSQAFRAHFRWCVGAPVYETDSHCNHCNSILPREGNHAMECLGGSDRIGRHNAIRDILEGAGKEAGLGPVKEKVGVFANNQQKPADIYLPGFFLGQDACVDVTVRSPLVSTVVGRAALTSLVAASVGVEEKRAKYGHMLPNNVVLRVVALETFGGCHA